MVTKICDWLSERMSMALHHYQVQTLLAISTVRLPGYLFLQFLIMFYGLYITTRNTMFTV